MAAVFLFYPLFMDLQTAIVFIPGKDHSMDLESTLETISQYIPEDVESTLANIAGLIPEDWKYMLNDAAACIPKEISVDNMM